jgi:hypothetical protein
LVKCVSAPAKSKVIGLAGSARPLREAKPEGVPLSGVEWQSAMYAEGLPAEVRLRALTFGGWLPCRIRGLLRLVVGGSGAGCVG